MPHIRVRGTTEKTVAHLSELNVKLAEIIETDPSNFTFESVQTHFYEAGQEAKGYPFVEVLWFSRSQEIKEALATFLTKTIQTLETHEYVTVIFRELDTNSYFENGQHF